MNDMHKQGFSIFVIHPGDVNNLAVKLTDKTIEVAIKDYVRAKSGIKNFMLEIEDFISTRMGGLYQVNGVQSDGIDPKIEDANFLIIIVGDSCGKKYFKHEIELVNSLAKPHVCFIPEKNTGGRRFIESTLKYDPEKFYLNRYKNKKKFPLPQDITVIGDAICREIEKLKQAEKKDGEAPIKQRRNKNAEKKSLLEAKNKLKGLFISDDLKFRYYYAFIDLLEPFYLDQRGEEKRKKLRKLFEITDQQEQEFIQKMQGDNLVKIIGELCLSEDKTLAVKLQNEILEKGVIDLGAILNLFP